MYANHLLFAALATFTLTAGAASGDRSANRAYAEGFRSELFAEFKSIESMSHHERIRILQEAENCIQAAADREQYRACESREQEGRDRLREQVRARHEALRARADAIRQGMLSQAGRN
jgi:hypothetical protein